MDRDRRVRIVFGLVNAAATLGILTATATLFVLGIVLLSWDRSWLLVLLGLLAGAAIGSIRDSRVFQAALGLSGVTLLGFALLWSSRSSQAPPEAVYTILGTGLLAFWTFFGLTRVWGREQRVPAPTVEDVDEMIARPSTG